MPKLAIASTPARKKRVVIDAGNGTAEPQRRVDADAEHQQVAERVEHVPEDEQQVGGANLRFARHHGRKRAHHRRSFLRQLDEDVFEAGAVDLEPQHPVVRGQRHRQLQCARLLVFERDVHRVLARSHAERLKCREHGVEVAGRGVERHSDFADPRRQQLQRVQIAAGHLPAFVDDQDVVAEILSLAQYLSGQHDRAAARGLPPQPIHDGPLQDGVHAGRELVEKHDRRVDHEDLRHLDAAAKPAAQVLRLPVGLRREAEFVHHPIGAPADRRAALAVEPRERQQVVTHRQQQLGGMFLNDDDDVAAYVRRLPDNIESHHACVA
jgi:hypothetical protein